MAGAHARVVRRPGRRGGAVVSADIMTVAIEAAREAGHLLLNGYGSGHGIETKHDHSLVTEYDRQSEALIVSKIREAFPRHSVMGEEGSRGGSDAEYCWIIDPLDGTHNFIRQIGHFGVSIGVTRGDEFIAGVIYLPREHEFYAAEKGNGAYCNEKPIRVSGVATLSKCSMCFDSSLRANPPLLTAVLADVSSRVFNLRIFGSSVRTLTYVADGRMDASLEFDDAPWDFAAGVALIQEAGGMATRLDGGQLTPRDHGYIASNGRVHDALISHLATHMGSAPRT
jgi:myo-inositol-1(or 4)-monophosphatase